MGLLPVEVGSNATLFLGGRRLQVEGEMAKALTGREGEHLTAGIRPEHWHLGPATNRNFKAKVKHCERLGNEQILTCRLEDGGHLIQARHDIGTEVNIGDEINLDPDPSGWRVFDGGGELIRGHH